MRNRTITLTLIAAVAILPQLAFGAEPDGAALYKQKCAACHGPDGSKNLPDLAKLDVAAIEKTVREGKKPKMPAYDESKISKEQLTALATFVHGLKK